MISPAQQQWFGSHLWQTPLWELWDSGRKLQNLSGAQDQGGQFWEGRLCPGNRFTNHYRPGNNPISMQICRRPWSCHQHHLPRDPGGVTPTWASVTGLLTLVSVVDSEEPKTQLQNLSYIQEWSCLARNPVKDVPIFAPRGLPTTPWSTWGSWSSPVIQLQPLLALVWGQSCLLRDLVGGMPILAARSRSAEFSPSCRPWRSPVTWF